MFFFFKQKTADEMLRSLVGSEMCIRDSAYILCFSKLNLSAITTNCVPSHSKKGKKKKLNHNGLYKRACTEPGKGQEKYGKHHEDKPLDP